MHLIPEQVRNIQEQIRRAQEEKNTYERYISERNLESIGESSRVRGNRDNYTETSYNITIDNLKELEKTIRTAQLVKKPITEHIDLGTKFVIKFDDVDEEENYTLAERKIGLQLHEGYITIESEIGKLLMGKTVGEEIYNKNNSPIGKIIEIKTSPEDYIQYIRNKPRSIRICRAEYRRLHQLNLEKETSKTAKKEYEKSKEITESQKELLEIEAERIIYQLKHSTVENKNYLQLRLGQIKKYLKELKVATPPTDNTIGIGTHFSIIMETPNQPKIIRRVELVNRALGDELDSDYIERLSVLGTAAYGKKEKDEFIIQKGTTKIKCEVFDIDNEKDNKKTNDPIAYQKTYKGRK